MFMSSKFIPASLKQTNGLLFLEIWHTWLIVETDYWQTYGIQNVDDCWRWSKDEEINDPILLVIEDLFFKFVKGFFHLLHDLPDW